MKYDDPGITIPPDFIGLSYESAVLATPSYFSPDNRSVLGLLRTLGSAGVLRIGGNSSERTFWQTSDNVHPPQDAYVIRPSAIDNLAGLLRALDWRLIYGLNLARGTPESAAEEAAYVAGAVGARLLAFQIGNEPDIFGPPVRPTGYSVAAFLSELRPFYDAIRARVPGAPFAGPAIASIENDWIPPFAETFRDWLVLLTRHYYADGPARAPHVNMERLLHSAPKAKTALAEMEAIARRYRLPYRIAEANSIFSEGHPGVSDTLGAGLWGLEFMFQIANAGAAGVNFHTGDAKYYTPIGPGEQDRHGARPLYYAMLAFADICRGGGTLLPTRLDGNEVDLAAYAVRAAGGRLRVCVVNKDLARSTRVRIDQGRPHSGASVLRLTGPGVDAKSGVTLGGAAVDDLGAWSPTRVERWSGGADFVIDVPAASAALIDITLA